MSRTDGQEPEEDAPTDGVPEGDAYDDDASAGQDPDQSSEIDYQALLDGLADRSDRAIDSWSAKGGMIHVGPVYGGQHVTNHEGGGSSGAGPVRAPSREGPIFAEEILAAQAGFAEPGWFAEAVKDQESRLVLLAGAPGSGRRTAALNLLHRRTAGMALRAVDGTVDLGAWAPDGDEVRGYLVDGLSQPQLLEGWMVNQLIGRLRKARACMVIVLPEVPGLVRELKRKLHLDPVLCEPPPTRQVFDAQLAARVPAAAEREALIAELDRSALDALLERELAPAHVAELVQALVEEKADMAAILERMSFLAEEEVPRLLARLQDQPANLALLLATCVFEGLDRHVVTEQAERLLLLADGRLDATIPGTQQEEQDRPNPRYVFAHSLDDLLGRISARRLPREIHSTSRFSYSVEPVRFVRHGQAEAVLRHLWREYGQLATLLTDWLETVAPVEELSSRVGRTMGMTARWGGGRRALTHIRKLANSDTPTTRRVAATALAIAAEDPVLAGEVRHLLSDWSTRGGWRLRTTVAYVCASQYGVSRPEHALKLLGRLAEGRREEADPVDAAVQAALRLLFFSGNKSTVLHHLSEWSEQGGAKAELAIRTFTYTLGDTQWFTTRLLSGGSEAEQTVDLVRRALNTDERFGWTSTVILRWCDTAAWNDDRRTAVEALLTALAHDMRHGVLRLFVAIDRHEDPALVGKPIAHRALDTWRSGRTPHSHGMTQQRNGTR